MKTHFFDNILNLSETLLFRPFCRNRKEFILVLEMGKNGHCFCLKNLNSVLKDFLIIIGSSLVSSENSLPHSLLLTFQIDTPQHFYLIPNSFLPTINVTLVSGISINDEDICRGLRDNCVFQHLSGDFSWNQISFTYETVDLLAQFCFFFHLSPEKVPS